MVERLLLLVLLTACGGPEPTSITSATGTPGSSVASNAPSAASSALASPSASSLSSASVEVSQPPPAKQPKSGLCEADGQLGKSSLRASRLDMHTYARFLADAFRKDIVAAGELANPKGQRCPGACLDFEERVTDLDQALALVGGRVTTRRGAVLIGEQVKATASPVLGPSPAVDLNLQRGSSVEIAQLLGDVAKRKITGAPEGEITLAVRGRPALDALALMADAAGTTVRTEGNAIAFAPGGSLPALSPEALKLKKGADEPRVLRDVIAAKQPLESLRVSALIRGSNGAMRAALSPREPGDLSWVVRIGDFVGKEMLLEGAGTSVAVNARIERIHCLGVTLVHEWPDPSRPPGKIELYLE